MDDVSEVGAIQGGRAANALEFVGFVGSAWPCPSMTGALQLASGQRAALVARSTRFGAYVGESKSGTEEQCACGCQPSEV